MFDNKYPYTDYHEMNLDWFLEKFKELVATWEQVQSDWNSLHDFVQNYFDNLDVQTEINNKINAMIADGSFATIVTPLVEAALPTIVDGKLPAVVAAQIGAVVAAQIDAVVAGQLPAVAAAAAAQEVGTWLTAHIDPDTGYVIDNTLTVSLAAADAKTVGDNFDAMYEKIFTDFNYFAFNSIDLDLTQGARGTDITVITPNSKYVTTGTSYYFPAGCKMILECLAYNEQCIVTEWTADGTHIGNVGSWSNHIDYTFTNKRITLSFKIGSTDITPSDIVINYSLKTPFDSSIKNLVNYMNNNFMYKKYDSYFQGFYNTSAVVMPSSTAVCAPMMIIDSSATMVFPYSDSYKISVYTWDYSGGSFSNFQQSGYITSDYILDVDNGKAVSCSIQDVNGANITPSDVDYVYFVKNKLSIIDNINTWTPKKVACIGDSLTEGVDIGTHVIAENYPYFMSKMLNCTVVNCGVAGADTKEYWHDNYDDYVFDNTLDAVLIMLGTNGGGIPDTLDTDVYPYGFTYTDYADTYCGCYCKIIMKVIEDTQNRAQVFLITPPYTTYSTTQLNRVKEARETIKKIGDYYNIPVIDVFGECGMGGYNASVFRPHDGCHFNAKGYHRLGTFIGSKIKSMHSNWLLTDVYPDETPTP